MTKAIKFNLLLDKHPVRDLDDLRANFNLDDLLTAYHSHTLHRWLEVRGLTAELEQLNAIKSTDELSISSALCELFQETLSEADIKTAVSCVLPQLRLFLKLCASSSPTSNSFAR